MGNCCPLCGSPGDDLVFRFYCSRKECANYVSDGAKERAVKDPKREELKKRLWAVYADRVVSIRTLCHEMGLDPSSFPRFTLERIPSGDGLRLVWKDKVPRALDGLVAPVLGRFVGERMGGQTEDMMRDDIIHRLLKMVQRGELVWNGLRSRWELYFTE